MEVWERGLAQGERACKTAEQKRGHEAAGRCGRGPGQPVAELWVLGLLSHGVTTSTIPEPLQAPGFRAVNWSLRCCHLFPFIPQTVLSHASRWLVTGGSLLWRSWCSGSSSGPPPTRQESGEVPPREGEQGRPWGCLGRPCRCLPRTVSSWKSQGLGPEWSQKGGACQ